MPTTFVRKLSTSNQNMNGNRPRLYNYWTLDAGCMAPWEQKMRLAVAYALCRLCSKSPVPPGKDEERGRRAVLQARPLHSLSDCGDGIQFLLRRIHAQQRKHGLGSEFMEETALHGQRRTADQ